VFAATIQNNKNESRGRKWFQNHFVIEHLPVLVHLPLLALAISARTCMLMAA
jgi:hypothetical protein